MADFGMGNGFGTPAAAPAADTLTAPVAAPAVGASKSTLPDVAKPYYAAAMTELRGMQERGETEVIHSKSSALIFQRILGDPTHPDKRAVGIVRNEDGSMKPNANGNAIHENVPCAKPIGYLFKTAAPVKIPVIAGKKTNVSGYAPEDLTWKDVPAGQQVIMTLLEVFVLASQVEYSFTFAAEVVDETGNTVVKPNEFKLSLRWDSVKSGKAKFPNIVPQLKSGGSPKENAINICSAEPNPDGSINWTSPEYEAKFGVFFIKNKRVKSGGATKAGKDNTVENAAICRALLADIAGRG